MINLLPDSYKKEIRAARSNVILLRYNFLLLGVAGFLILSGLIVFAVLGAAKGSAQATSESNTSRAAEFASTGLQANEYRENLKTAKKILDNEVIYTDLVFAITNLLPSGIILDGLNLNSKEFGTQTLLSAHAKNYAAVTALKQAFEKSTVFSNVHFQSINASEAAGSSTGYPIGVSINVTMNKVVKK